MTRHVDIIIVGSGFAGSIMAMIQRRLGRSVAILERGKHPRFAIGESSTPLANLLLEELAAKYDLPDLATFSKWGTWQAAHPEIACGLKRGFTFYKNQWNRRVDFEDRSQQLLVAASPNDRIADTHWYRPAFDAHLARQAVELGAELFEQAQFTLREADNKWIAESKTFTITAPFLIDASGPRGCLFQHFKMEESRAGFMETFPVTQAIFAHFKNVKRLDRSAPDLPYPVDDAAVHHIFDGGWIWVLRFNNGITSAGAALTKPLAQQIQIEQPGAWERLIERLPTLRDQFANSQPVTQFFTQKQIAFRAPRAAGPNWAMLPSAAGFVDPLFSTGFVLTLLGIQRIAENDPDYEAATFADLDRAGHLVENAYRSFSDFESFAQVSRSYFTSAIWSETLRRLGRTPPPFLCVPDRDCDLAGLNDRSRNNWHPARAEDLFANAWKIPATRKEVEAMLQKCGFNA